MPFGASETVFATMLLVLALGSLWVILRFVFKMAMRVFMFGLYGIVILGALAYLASQFTPLP
jgi:hypothetical protein